jgi:hypothetical protein
VKKYLTVEVLSSSTLDSRYFDCVKFFIDYWLNIKGSSGIIFLPKVILLADRIPPDLEKYSKYIFPFSDERISNSFASQVVRILYPSLSNSDLVMTSDIDMLPIKNGNISKVLADIYGSGLQHDSLKDFVIFRDVLVNNQIPICYNIGAPSTWETLNGCRSEIDVRTFLFNEFNKISLIHSPGPSNATWYRDQEILYDLRKKNIGKINFISLDDSITGYKRLDRLSVKTPFHWFLLPKIIFGNYDSYHIHHPVANHLLWYRVILFIMKVIKSLDF